VNSDKYLKKTLRERLRALARRCRAFLEDGDAMEPHKLLRRKAASKYLYDVHGVVRAPSTLAKYAVIGGGPIFQLMGRDPVYTPPSLDEWVASKLSGPMRSTSDRDSLPGERIGGRQQGDPSGASDSGADKKSKTCERSAVS
jgi:hypothetical protein